MSNEKIQADFEKNIEKAYSIVEHLKIKTDKEKYEIHIREILEECMKDNDIKCWLSELVDCRDINDIANLVNKINKQTEDKDEENFLSKLQNYDFNDASTRLWQKIICKCESSDEMQLAFVTARNLLTKNRLNLSQSEIDDGFAVTLNSYIEDSLIKETNLLNLFACIHMIQNSRLKYIILITEVISLRVHPKHPGQCPHIIFSDFLLKFAMNSIEDNVLRRLTSAIQKIYNFDDVSEKEADGLLNTLDLYSPHLVKNENFGMGQHCLFSLRALMLLKLKKYRVLETELAELKNTYKNNERTPIQVLPLINEYMKNDLLVDFYNREDISDHDLLECLKIFREKTPRSSEIESSRKILIDNWILNLVRKVDKGNTEHVFIILEGSRYDRKLDDEKPHFIWYSELTVSPDKPNNAIIKTRKYSGDWDTKFLTNIEETYLSGVEVAAQSWDLSRRQAIQLQTAICEEERQISNGEKTIHYQKFGDASLLAKSSSTTGHNCFTWARDKINGLKAENVQIKTSFLDWIATVPSFHIKNKHHMTKSRKPNTDFWKMRSTQVASALAVGVGITAVLNRKCTIQ